MSRILRLLNEDHKKLFFYIGVLIVVLSFLEILTLSLLQPIIGYFSESSTSNIFIFKLFFFRDLSILYILLLFFIFFFLRAILSVFISYKKHKFIKSINDYLCDKILKNYLHNDYIFFLKNKSSSMSSIIINEVEKFSYRLIDACINLFTEIFVVSAVFLFLLINYFNETVILAVVTITFFGSFYYFYKSKFKKLGMLKSSADSQKMQDLQNSFYAIQPIKLENVEDIFIQNFKISTEKSSDSQFHLSFMTELPKPAIEILVLFIIFLMLGISYVYLDFDSKQIISTLGLFLVAMFRILPSTNRIIGSLNNIKFYTSSVSIIEQELKNFEVKILTKEKKFFEELPNVLFQKNIKLENVNFIYPFKQKKIINNLNLTINKNEMIAILGANGSGKSTLLNILCSLLKPETGKILIDGHALTEDKIKAYQKKISFVQQKTVLLNASILNNITFANKFDQNNQDDTFFLESVLEDCNLKNFIHHLPEDINTNIGEMGNNLSGGEMQKIAIARALYKKSEVLFLDEATSALDEKSEKEISKTILKLKGKITIIIVTHKKNMLEYCDKVYNLDNLQGAH
jgi:ATP-binding cassette, subfamily B, bacterial PglK